MHPVQEEYLSVAALIHCEAAYDLKVTLGETKLQGALTMFNILHPEEVKLFTGLPSFSFTILLRRVGGSFQSMAVQTRHPAAQHVQIASEAEEAV